MNNNDYLQRFLFEKIAVRGELVHLQQSYQTIIEQHDYPDIIKQLLGEALVIVSLLGAIIKFKGRLSLQFQGNSNLKLILVQTDEAFHLRALAQWTGQLDPTSLREDLQKGVLVITMDSDSHEKRYQGIVAWEGDSLAHSIEGYFRNSEQLLTRIWLAVNEERAAGLLLQVTPREAEHDSLTPDQDWEYITTLTETITPKELLYLNNAEILHRLFVEEDIRIFEETPISFQCTCTRKRGENAILLLGREEAEDELTNKQTLVVRCDFCNHEFVFDRNDVDNIFLHNGTPPSSIH